MNGSRGARVFPALEDPRACPHMAALVKSVDELPSVLAHFYRLGASRNGWLAYTSLPGETDYDRARLIAAGLDVIGLEAAGRFVMAEIDLSLEPAAWIRPWIERLNAAVDAGFTAMWFARFPIAPGQEDVAGVRPFEALWMAQFGEQRVVTLCPYIVAGLDEAALTARAREIAQTHDRVDRLVAGVLAPVAGLAPAEPG